MTTLQTPDGGLTITGASDVTVTETSGTVLVIDNTTGGQQTAEGISFISITGSDGNDKISYTGDSIGATIHGGAGDDVIQVSDTATAATSATGSAASTIFGDAGNDVISINVGHGTFADGGKGNDILIGPATGTATITGGAGTDIIIATAGTTVTASSGRDIVIQV